MSTTAPAATTPPRSGTSPSSSLHVRGARGDSSAERPQLAVGVEDAVAEHVEEDGELLAFGLVAEVAGEGPGGLASSSNAKIIEILLDHGTELAVVQLFVLHRFYNDFCLNLCTQVLKSMMLLLANVGP